MNIWAVRHAQPLIPPGICYGHLDIAADPEATRLAANDLASTISPSVNVYFSPLERCAALATALKASRPDLKFFEDTRLKEMNFGIWEGRPWSEIDSAELRAWTDDFSSYAPAGAESIHGFVTRVKSARDDCVASLVHDETVVWITHAGVIKALSVLAAQKTATDNYSAKDWPRTPIAFGSATRFEFTLSTKASST